MKRQTNNKDVKSTPMFFLLCFSGSIKTCILRHTKEMGSLQLNKMVIKLKMKFSKITN